MRRRVRLISSVVLSVLILAMWAYAKGPKTPIVFQTVAAPTGGTASVTLCDVSSPIPCNGGTAFTCPTDQLFGPDSLTKDTCGPAGFKVVAFRYTINATGVGGCNGVAQEGTTITCDVNGATVAILKVGH